MFRTGAILAYGQPVEIVPKIDAADVILAIDSDLLSSAPGHLRFARDFASRRNPVRTQDMSRIYAVEPTPTLIGSVADHRFIAGPRSFIEIVMALAAAMLRGHFALRRPGLGERGRRRSHSASRTCARACRAGSAAPKYMRSCMR